MNGFREQQLFGQAAIAVDILVHAAGGCQTAALRAQHVSLGCLPARRPVNMHCCNDLQDHRECASQPVLAQLPASYWASTLNNQMPVLAQDLARIRCS